MQKLVSLCGHTERVLSMDVSPRGNMVVSASADKTLRFWDCLGPNSTIDDVVRESLADGNGEGSSAVSSTKFSAAIAAGRWIPGEADRPVHTCALPAIKYR